MYIAAIILGEDMILHHESRAMTSFLTTTFTEEERLSIQMDYFFFTRDEKLPGKIHALENANFYYGILPENADEEGIVKVIREYDQQNRYDYLIFGTTVSARNLAVKYATQEKKRLATNIKEGVFTEQKRWKKDIFLGNVTEEIFATNHMVITLAKNVPAVYTGFCHPIWKKITMQTQLCSHIITCTREKKSTATGWEQAEKIIVIGNGVDKGGYPLIEQFAKQIHAEIAGTRRAVENGLLPVERMIGISGKSISPKLCIVIGASGLAAFVKGIEKSEMIFSINADKDALIFNYSDYGIVARYQEILKTK